MKGFSGLSPCLTTEAPESLTWPVLSLLGLKQSSIRFFKDSAFVLTQQYHIYLKTVYISKSYNWIRRGLEPGVGSWQYFTSSSPRWKPDRPSWNLSSDMNYWRIYTFLGGSNRLGNAVENVAWLGRIKELYILKILWRFQCYQLLWTYI